MGLAINLVRDQGDRFLGFPEHCDNGFVCGRDSDGGVNHKQYRISYFDRTFCLISDLRGEAFYPVFPTAGVCDSEKSSIPLGFIENSVSSHAGDVFDHCLSPTDDAVY